MLLFMSFSIAELGLPPTIELWGHEWGRKMLQAFAIAHSYGTGDRTRLHQAEESICTTLTFCWLLPAILGPNVLLRIGSRNIYIRTGASATTPDSHICKHCSRHTFAIRKRLRQIPRTCLSTITQ